MSSCSLLPLCFRCARLRGVEPGVGWACDAFPRGIPVDVLASVHDHHDPLPGDGGLTFKLRQDGAARDDLHGLGCAYEGDELPIVSEAQRRAMFAAKAGHSKIGIPASVGREFTESDPGGGLPERVARDMTPDNWKVLRWLLGKFLGEEERETEHAETTDRERAAVPAWDSWQRKGRAASVAFTTADGRVLLLRRRADDDNWPDHWCLPGGKADGDEGFEVCARREAAEEVGDCAFDGMAELGRVRTPNDFEHATFAVPVEEPFEPTLSDEHTDWTWAPVTNLPEKTHPGVARTIDGIILDAQTRHDPKNGQFTSGPGTGSTSSKPEAAGTGTVHSGSVNLAEKGLKPRGRGSNAGLQGAAEVAWYVAKRDNRNVVATPGGYGRGWTIAREGEKIPHRHPHIIVTPSGEMHKFQAPKGEGESAEDVWDLGNPEGALSPSTRERIGPPGSEHREDMPEGAFLGPHRTYPVKEKNDKGEWAYTRALLLAAARRARMEGEPSIAKRADEIRGREFQKSDGEDATCDPDRRVVGGEDRWTDRANRFALDRSVRQLDVDGRMHVADATICQGKVDSYYGHEVNGAMSDVPGWTPLEPDRKYRLLRDPVELAKPETVASANQIPILSRHEPTDARDHKFDETVGSTGSGAKFTHIEDETGKKIPVIRNALVFWPQGAIDGIDDGSKAQLSPGYRYRAEMEPGTFEGEPYDGRMVDIRFNHLAQVDRGRQGPHVVVPDADPDHAAWSRIERALMDLAA